jgi:hypothetical protein
MNICRAFFVSGLACLVPVSAGAVTHHAHPHHHHHHARHAAVAPAAPVADAVPAPVPSPAQAANNAAVEATHRAVGTMPAAMSGKLAVTPVAESRRHARRRVHAPASLQAENAALFIPPARIRHIPPPMKGTHASLLHQNEMAREEHIGRIEDDADLLRMRKEGLLVPIPVTAVLRVNPELPANRRYVRPWTGRFLSDLSRAHYKRYHSYIKVNSAVRTVEFQRALLRVNANAAPAEGSLASPHLTGQTIDIAKKDLNSQEVAWMRLYLAPLQRAGKLDVEEEFQQACFHISVYKSYLTPAKRRAPAPAPVRREGDDAALLAATMR